jgi:hypothetical protein
MAEWSCSGLQSRGRRFDSDSRLQFSRLAALAALAAALALSQPAAAQGASGSFSQGRTHVFIGGGTGSAFSESYFVVSVGATYYLLDGLGVGLAYERWTGADPSMYKITPAVQYVFQQLPLKPYVGAFFRRTSIEDRPDLDSAGARAGVYFQAARNAHIGIGGVYESYLDCSRSTYRECDSFYPEVSFTFAF